MRTRSLVSQHQRIVWLIDQANSLDSSQLEMRAHWARYICVLASGFLENAIKDVYSQYARSRSDTSVADYVESSLSKIQNPKSSKFIETANLFNKQWGDDLNVFVDLQGRKDAIDAIMSNRHLIAHGKDSGITLVRIKDYLVKSVEVIEFIESQCGLNA